LVRGVEVAEQIAGAYPWGGLLIPALEQLFSDVGAGDTIA